MRQRRLDQIKETLKKNQELDSKIKKINEEYQILMKPVTVAKLDKAFKGVARSYEVSITIKKIR